MTDDLDIRRRRAAWRAGHRGTKELDFMIGGYAAAVLETISSEDLARFERFLAVSDPDLQDWLLKPDGTAGTEFADLVTAVRTFHGLE